MFRQLSNINYARLSGACYKPEIVELLIADGADVNAINRNDLTALMYARNPEVIELLITAGANVNATNRNGLTALSIACINDKQEVIQLLIEAGADLEATDKYGKTALMCTYKPEVVKLLIEAGADEQNMLVRTIKNNSEIIMIIIIGIACLWWLNELLDFLDL